MRLGLASTMRICSADADVDLDLSPASPAAARPTPVHRRKHGRGLGWHRHYRRQHHGKCDMFSSILPQNLWRCATGLAFYLQHEYIVGGAA
jgi:hypothetical protein